MRRFWLLTLILIPVIAAADPATDLKTYRTYFAKKFPNVPDKELVNGVYALDEKLRQNWEQIEDFPPYEIAIAKGEALWKTPFANGKGYADCFKKPGVQSQYPHWDEARQEVVTLEYAVNLCRQQHGEQPLKYQKGPMAELLAYMAYQSRGQKVNVKIPNTPGAIAAYEQGKRYYFTRRGQLNFACVHCHFSNAGMLLRSNRLSAARGQVTHFPAYRSEWGEVGTLHRRYVGCNEQVRAKALEPESEAYRNLEFFHTHMSNGLPLSGPGTRF